jgi:hypothetical protein
METEGEKLAASLKRNNNLRIAWELPTVGIYKLFHAKEANHSYGIMKCRTVLFYLPWEMQTVPFINCDT